MQGLFFRHNGVDHEIIDGNVDFALDVVTKFKVNILASGIDWRNIRGDNVELYDNGELIISGFIDKSPKLKMKSDAPLTVQLVCIGGFASLTLERAKSTAHYQNQQVVGIINDLFTTISESWTVSLVNMVDPLIETTLDLRNKETAFAQIAEVVKSVPDLHMRYGGINLSGEKVLELGNFNDVTCEALQGSNLLDVNVNYSTNKIYKTIESFGDLTPTDRINLNDALSDSRTTLHPDYAQFPISQDPTTLVWICTNTSVTNGSNIRKSMNVVKTKNNATPTPAEVAEAGYALWLKTVRLMKESIDSETYSGNFLSKVIPSVGDKMRLTGKIKETVYDSFSGFPIDDYETFSVDNDFRITSIGYSFKKQSMTEDFNVVDTYKELSFSVTSVDESVKNDSELDLYERLERFDNYDSTSGGVEVYPIQITTLTYGNADAADCNAAGGSPPPSDGKDYTIASPSYPFWATQVTTWYDIVGDGVVQVLTPPAAIGNSWSACVQTTGGVWPPAAGKTVSITVFWLFT